MSPGRQNRDQSSSGQAYRRASEIGAYAYCAHAWWLRYQLGFDHSNPELLERGRDAHAMAGRRIGAAQGKQRLALIVLMIALALLGIALLQAN